MTQKELVNRFLVAGPFGIVYQGVECVIVNIQALPGGVDVTLRNDWGADWIVDVEELTGELSHA